MLLSVHGSGSYQSYTKAINCFLIKQRVIFGISKARPTKRTIEEMFSYETQHGAFVLVCSTPWFQENTRQLCNTGDKVPTHPPPSGTSWPSWPSWPASTPSFSSTRGARATQQQQQQQPGLQEAPEVSRGSYGSLRTKHEKSDVFWIIDSWESDLISVSLWFPYLH